MKPPRRTIRGKLVTAMMLTSTTVLVLAGTVLVAHFIISVRRLLVRELGTRAEILAANSTAALAFENPEDATEVLAALRRDPTITAAVLYDARGHQFASYPRALSGPPAPAATARAGHQFTGDHLIVIQPVIESGRRLGTVYLQSDLSTLDERIRVHVLVVLLAVAGSVLVAFVLSIWLQRRITGPVRALAEAARTVSEQKDYSVRAGTASDDELGALAVAFDEMLREIQQRDSEIRALNADLEQRVAARTAELAASNQELEAFSYSVSHDLRAPLRAIDGFSKALLDDWGDRLDDTGRRHLERVRGATGRMSRLIDDLLDLARLSRAELHRQVVDLSAISHEIAAGLQQAQPERAVTFDIAEGVVAEGDTQLLRVALDNLLSNAWKFTAKHPTARIEFGSSNENSHPVYYVRDDGAGFDMDHAALLFAPFQRLHRQADFEGTGVGLATVQRVIHRHAGRLWAEGAVEHGATFYFTLWENLP